MIAMEVARNNDHVYTLGNCCFRREATYYDARLGGVRLHGKLWMEKLGK